MGEKTKVLVPASLRNVVENWEQVYGENWGKLPFITKKMENLSLTLYHLNPTARKIFSLSIPERFALKLGTASFDSISNIPIEIKEINWLSIDPGRKLDGFGMIIWRSSDSNEILWVGKGIIIRNNEEWNPADISINKVVKNTYVRGIIGPWWGFVLKGY